MKSFVKRSMILALVLVLMLGLLAGCGGSGGSTNGDPSGGEKVLKIRKKTPLASTDWEQNTLSEDMRITWIQVFEGLYGVREADGGYFEALAKNVELNDDETVYTITLEDAKFHNGDELKASDVVFSYKRAMDNARYNYITNMISSVEAADDKTVVITLDYPYAAIAHTFFSLKISSEREVTEAGDKFGSAVHTAGTGPYVITGFDPAGGVKLEAFEDYWQGVADIKKVEFVVIEEDASAVIAYENNEIDFIHEAPTAEWDALEKAAGGNAEVLKGNSIRTLNINWESPTNDNILGNEDIRKAIFYAVKKDEVLQAATNGYGAVANEYIPSEYSATSPPASAGGFETYDYNIEKAKEHVKKAGFSDADIAAGINIGTLTTYGAQTGEKAKSAIVIQSNLAEIGLICDIEVADNSVITPRLHAFDYDICIYGDSGNFDFNNIRQQVHSESVGMNVVNYAADNSPLDYKRVEELCDLGVSTVDVEQRLEYYTELWSRVMDSATMLPLINMPAGMVWSDRVDLGKLSPSYYHIYDFSWK